MSKFYNDGEGYYIDIESITDRCKITGADEEGNESTEVNIFKYEVLKMCIDRVLGDFEEDDTEMIKFKGKSLSFQIAFNTLLKNEIIIEDNE
jgi:hypothetical protein